MKLMCGKAFVISKVYTYLLLHDWNSQFSVRTASTHRMETTQRVAVAMTPAVCLNTTVLTSRTPSEVCKCLRAKGRGWETWRQVNIINLDQRSLSVWFYKNCPSSSVVVFLWIPTVFHSERNTQLKCFSFDFVHFYLFSLLNSGLV